jgi:hypothetical protein
MAVENVLGANHNLWEVNVDREYHEEFSNNGDSLHTDLIRLSSTQPANPERLSARRQRPVELGESHQ